LPPNFLLRERNAAWLKSFYDLNNMPPETMRQLAWVNIVHLVAMFAWFIYCTPAITSYQFGHQRSLSNNINDALIGWAC